MMKPRPFRIKDRQATSARAKQALMIAATELDVLVYRQPYQVGDTAQRESLIHTLNTEFHTSIPLPPKKDGRAVVYLIVVDGVPAVIPEDDVQAVVFGVALAKGGRAAADRVSYRPGMLPAS